MKNKLADLNDHLFCQIERLNDDSLTDEDLNKEIARASSISDIASNIIKNAAVILKANELRLEYGLENNDTKQLLTDK